jgi:hypothetical protein
LGSSVQVLFSSFTSFGDRSLEANTIQITNEREENQPLDESEWLQIDVECLLHLFDRVSHLNPFPSSPIAGTLFNEVRLTSSIVCIPRRIVNGKALVVHVAEQTLGTGWERVFLKEIRERGVEEVLF